MYLICFDEMFQGYNQFRNDRTHLVLQKVKIRKKHLLIINVEQDDDPDTAYAFAMTGSYQLFRARVWSNGGEGEDAIVQRSWVVEVLQDGTKEL